MTLSKRHIFDGFASVNWKSWRIELVRSRQEDWTRYYIKVGPLMLSLSHAVEAI